MIVTKSMIYFESSRRWRRECGYGNGGDTDSSARSRTNGNTGTTRFGGGIRHCRHVSNRILSAEKEKGVRTINAKCKMKNAKF